MTEFDKVIKDFERLLISQKKSKNTIACYISDLNNFKSFYNNQKLEYLTENHMVQYKQLLQQDKSTKTIARKLHSLHKFCAFLITKKLIQKNPLDAISIPKTLQTKKTVFTQEERTQIFDLAKVDPKVYLAFTLLFQTGVLISELVNIHKKDISLSTFSGTLYVHKMNKREIALNDKAFFVINHFLQSKNFHGTYLFVTSKKTPILVRNMRTYLSRILKKAEISKTVNDIRNTFIVEQLAAGNSIEFVAGIVGHNSTQATEKYVKLVQNYKNKQLDTIVEV